MQTTRILAGLVVNSGLVREVAADRHTPMPRNRGVIQCLEQIVLQEES